MNFSIILNSRGRANLLRNLISNIKDTASRIDEIELLIAIDDDDSQSIALSKEEKPFDITFVIQPRPDSLNTSLTNLGKLAKGKYVFNLNDDLTILTKSWDTIILSKIEEFKKKNSINDDILYIGCSDTSMDKPTGSKYASFPIITKKSIDILGFFMDPVFVGLGADSGLWRIFDSVNRVLYIEDVVLDHFFHSTIFAVMSPDLTAYEMRQNSAKHFVDCTSYPIEEDTSKLKNYIENHEEKN